MSKEYKRPPVKAEGIWGCTVVAARAGEDKRALNVQIDVVIDDGPSKGMRATYEDQVNGKSNKYIAQSCMAVGWQGKSLRTLADDVKAWIERTGGKTTVEIRHIAVSRGAGYDRWVEAGCPGEPPVWDKASAIGRGAAKPLAAPSKDVLDEADELMRMVTGAEDVGSVPAEPEPGYGGGAPVPASDDDIPFLTCSRAALGEIAKVLR